MWIQPMIWNQQDWRAYDFGYREGVGISFNQTGKKVPGACSKQKKQQNKSSYLWSEVDEQIPQEKEIRFIKEQASKYIC